MFRWIAALAIGLCATMSHAQVVPQDLNGNSTADAFLDVANGLMWTRPGVVSALGFDSGETATTALVVEGLSGWHLPSLAQLQGLYATQGQVGLAMKAAPFPAYGTWYWTTDVFSKNTLQNMAFSPGNGAAMPYFRTTEVNVWAVRAVPEPASGLLLALGAVAVGSYARLRRTRC
jgi:hypothetical protein